MEKLVCTQCGAPINVETLVCEFCGSVFLSSRVEQNKKELEKPDVPNVSDAKLNNLIKDYIKNNSKAIWFASVFYALAIVIATIVLVSVLDRNVLSILSAILIASIVVATILIIKNIFTSERLYYKNIVKTLNENNYQKVYEDFKHFEEKKHNDINLYGQILIGFYRLEKFDEVREIIINMDAKELSQIIHANTNIISIAKSLNIKVPVCQDPHCNQHFHTH